MLYSERMILIPKFLCGGFVASVNEDFSIIILQSQLTSSYKVLLFQQLLQRETGSRLVVRESPLSAFHASAIVLNGLQR